MQKKLKSYTAATFSSLRIRNYRLYFIGQGISLSGTWLQTIAQTWLVFQLTGSGTYIGLVVAAQFLPVLLLGPFGGLVADRYSNRRLLYGTQAAAMILSLVLALLVLSNTVQVWMVFVLAVLLGVVRVIDNPTRQTFILEMVGRKHLTNAIILNSVEANMARIIGPAFAGLLIAGVGIGYCFLINAFSYLAVLLCLGLMRAKDLRAAPTAVKARGQLREGFRYVRQTPAVRTILLMMAAIGTLAYEFPVVLPILASNTFNSGAGGFSLLMTAMGIGAVAGGLLTASRLKATQNSIAVSAIGLGVAMLLTAVAQNLYIAAAAMVLVGFASISFTSAANSTLQLLTAPDMRGRVMALWTVAFIGSTPIGGPIIGYISEHTSARVGLTVGGLVAIGAGLYAFKAKSVQSRQPNVHVLSGAE